MTPKRRSRSTAPIVTAALAVVGIVVLIIAIAVGGSPAAAAAPSNPSTALGTPDESLAGEASGLPSDASPSLMPTATPKPTPKPTAKPEAPAVWSKPTRIKGFEICWSVVVAIDDRGVNHLAATCGYGDRSQIRYAVSTDARTWKTTALTPPVSRLEADPQLAVSGKKLYLAYTRLAPIGDGCGDDGREDIGVYYRTRTLPSGTWSAATRIGKLGDRLQSFRVSDKAIHATVMSEKDRTTTYETVTGATLVRYPIDDAVGGTSLRVGDDGKARIAYESTHGISFGMVNGDRFSSAKIPGSTNGFAPALTLGPGNVAYVIWTRSYHGVGCAGPGPDPEDGTYVATNATGAWVSRRLTPAVGSASMTLDPATGELSAAVEDGNRIVYFHDAAGGDWTHETAAKTGGASVQIRADRTNGALLLAYVRYPDQGEPYVVVLTRR